MEKFEITLVENWEKQAIPGGVHIFNKAGKNLQIQIVDNSFSEAEDKAMLRELAEKYDGTPIAEVMIVGVKFFTTTYTAYGKQQSFYSAVKNHEQIKIQMCGGCYETNEEIKAMIDSIVFHF